MPEITGSMEAPSSMYNGPSLEVQFVRTQHFQNYTSSTKYQNLQGPINE
jgi:hypothetical protein